MGNVLCVPKVDRTVEAESAAPRKKRNLGHWFRKKVLRKRPRAADTPPVSTNEDEENHVLMINRESVREEDETRELTMLMELQERPNTTSARPTSPPTVASESAVSVRSSRHVVSASYSIDAIHGVAIVSVAGRLFVVRSTTSVVTSQRTMTNRVNRSRSLTVVATSHGVQNQLLQLRDLISGFNSGCGFDVEAQLRNGVITLVSVTTESKFSLASGSALFTHAGKSTLPALPQVTGSTLPALTWRPNSWSEPKSLPKVPSYLLVAAQSYTSSLSIPEILCRANHTPAASSSTSIEPLKLSSSHLMAEVEVVYSNTSSSDILSTSRKPLQVQTSALITQVQVSNTAVTTGSELTGTILKAQSTSSSSSSTSLESGKLPSSDPMAKPLMICAKTSPEVSGPVFCQSNPSPLQTSAMPKLVQDLNKTPALSSEIPETILKAQPTSTAVRSTSIESHNLPPSKLMVKPPPSVHSKDSSADMLPMSHMPSSPPLQSSSSPRPPQDLNIHVPLNAGSGVQETPLKAQPTQTISSSTCIEPPKLPSPNVLDKSPVVCSKAFSADSMPMSCQPYSLQGRNRPMQDLNRTLTVGSEIPKTTTKIKPASLDSISTNIESVKLASSNTIGKPSSAYSKHSPADILPMSCQSVPPLEQYSALPRPMQYLNKTFTVVGSEGSEIIKKAKASSKASSSTGIESSKLASSTLMAKPLTAYPNTSSVDDWPMSCLPNSLPMPMQSSKITFAGSEVPETILKTKSSSLDSTSTNIESVKVVAPNVMEKALGVCTKISPGDILPMSRQLVPPLEQRSALPRPVLDLNKTITMGLKVPESTLKAKSNSTRIESLKLASSSLTAKPQMTTSKASSADSLPVYLPQLPTSNLPSPAKSQKQSLPTIPTDTQSRVTTEETKSTVKSATTIGEVKKLIAIGGHVPAPPSTSKPTTQFRRQFRINQSTYLPAQSPDTRTDDKELQMIKPKIDRYQHFKSTPRPVPMKTYVSDFMVPKKAKAQPPTPLKLKIPKPHMNAIPAIAKDCSADNVNWTQVEGKGPRAQMAWCRKAPLFNVTFPPLGKRLLKRAGTIERIQEYYVLPQIRQIDIVKLECNKFPGIRVPMSKRDDYNMIIAAEKERHDTSDKSSSSDDASWGSEPSESP